MDYLKTVSLIKRARHDFGNHLQVLNGYLELGRPEHVKEYIGQIIDEMNAEKIIFSLDNPEASLYFYEQLLLARNIGVNLVYSNIDSNCFEIIKRDNEPINSLKSLINDNNIDINEDMVVELDISKDSIDSNDVKMKFTFEKESRIIRLFI
ncbi:Spo0B domain-containing protein [Candidatus Syntrophocurvum alkaliphilum]|uniref:Spo0B domain-containing protein n=1 Tax=Candidatus Syntrophocurvum alkaliphilum TaxID=2293317 RepID=UPI0018CCCB61|nr:Spo0B domain-containing protein [Candidatus Syntrophocurvum alkaliphilum]